MLYHYNWAQRALNNILLRNKWRYCIKLLSGDYVSWGATHLEGIKLGYRTANERADIFKEELMGVEKKVYPFAYLLNLP